MNQLTQHFGLTSTPFNHLDPRHPYSSEDLGMVRRTLDRFLLTGGIALCAGEPGAGKTFAVEAWSHTLNPNSYSVRWLDDPGDSKSSFLRRSVRVLGMAPAYSQDKVFHQLVDGALQLHQETARRLLFVLDEAQDLPLDVLEQVRRLTNLNRRGPLPLSFVLVAHRDFLAPLSQQHLTPLRRRIVATASLQGLTRDEVGPYLEHHLQRAGARSAVFGEDAVELLWSASQGLPRLINRTALQALAAAADQDRRVVEASVLQSVIAHEECL